MKLTLAVAALASLLASCGARSSSPPKVSVAAASSLRDLMLPVAARFATAHFGVTMSYSCDASSALSRQIEAGAPFDVFLSADAESVDRLGPLVQPGSRCVFLRNRLALVGRKGLPGSGLASIPDGAKVAIAGTEVPAGKAWRKYLEQAGALQRLEGRLVIAKNVSAALSLFDSEAADFALVFLTDAQVARREHSTWSPPDGPTIEYVAAIVAGHDSGPALDFLKWLDSPEFLGDAKAHGFEAPPPR